ncbi:hypothetical protein [Miniphocaeibacter halophilus]|uniref:Uncharacterized protein n=1 Tax=Miniphocaeibacter halophilus TaxID=2931922 RepID=A0AC61MTA1_9FIRM|nr:hypothetical protein [Miniphocaeibacter halophilus]QQK08796.1 hypothetical protein JFY71_04490 [Miniphocaeibacter halophilus]
MNFKKTEIENNKIINKLTRENYAVYKKIDYYIGLNDGIDKSKLLIKNDIVNMLYDGQNRGDRWEEVIGEDYKAFADAIYESKKKMSFKLISLYYSTYLASGFLIAMLLNIFFNFMTISYVKQRPGEIRVFDLSIFTIFVVILTDIFFIKIQNIRKVFSGKVFGIVLSLGIISPIFYPLIENKIGYRFTIISFIVLAVLSVILFFIKPKEENVQKYYITIFSIFIAMMVLAQFLRLPEFWLSEKLYMFVLVLTIIFVILLSKKYKREVNKWINS